MNGPTINYPRCKFCKFALINPENAENGRCHFEPPILYKYQTNHNYVSTNNISFIYPIIHFKTGGCSRMKPIEAEESEFEEVTEFDEDDASPPQKMKIVKKIFNFIRFSVDKKGTQLSSTENRIPLSEKFKSKSPKTIPGRGHRWPPPSPPQKDPDEKKGL